MSSKTKTKPSEDELKVLRAFARNVKPHVIAMTQGVDEDFAFDAINKWVGGDVEYAKGFVRDYPPPPAPKPAVVAAPLPVKPPPAPPPPVVKKPEPAPKPAPPPPPPIVEEPPVSRDLVVPVTVKPVGPAPTSTETIEALLDRAGRSGVTALRVLAGEIRDLVVNLAADMDEVEQEREAAAEVETMLDRQRVAVQARIDQLTAELARLQSNGGLDLEEVRMWARGAGLQVADHGQVSMLVKRAYLAAKMNANA